MTITKKTFSPAVAKKLLYVSSSSKEAGNSALWDAHDPRHLKVPLQEELPQTPSSGAVRPLRSLSDSLGASLAFLRVERDNLERQSEELALKEAELATAFELCESVRDEYVTKYTDIQQRVMVFESSLQKMELQLRETTSDLAKYNIEERRKKTVSVLENEFRVLLARLEHNINVNQAKLGRIEKRLRSVQISRQQILGRIEDKEGAMRQLMDLVDSIREGHTSLSPPALEKTLAA